ncbi:DUF2637 domain-containing protein [Streptomyces sp. NBC_01264]|uniref:DUF2637 domain-containing protein n=1 Tax=Streptomyces sp. NBC_01264 TaxID=2903804 RepID=UPI00225A76E1|nr:DUF2637 domain-containing protein [Streptomyces sp. NBC_01264]MCX4776812.1 DUF2637 domain-containing protein [Streptomyces sp. NBC_01264]
MKDSPAHTVAPIGFWDRLAIITLGTAGCALSYDALQQMAVAIHVRGFLTYLFPLVVDGFIAYGVRALLVLAEAPLRARLYVWTLFGTATASSIWANALHAVRLNQQALSPNGLQLGDTVVAILSTLAPLALAGAVHLYILITRHHPADQMRTRPADQPTTPLVRSSTSLVRSVASEADVIGPDRLCKVIVQADQEEADHTAGRDPHSGEGDETVAPMADHPLPSEAGGGTPAAALRPHLGSDLAAHEPEPDHGRSGKAAGGIADQALPHPVEQGGPDPAADHAPDADPALEPPGAGPDPASDQHSDRTGEGLRCPEVLGQGPNRVVLSRE